MALLGDAWGFNPALLFVVSAAALVVVFTNCATTLAESASCIGWRTVCCCIDWWTESADAFIALADVFAQSAAVLAELAVEMYLGLV